MNDNVTLEMARTTIIALASFLRQALPTLAALDLAPDASQPLAVQLEQAFNGLVLKTCQLTEDAKKADALRESLHALKQRIRYVENAQRDPATLLDDVAWLLNDSGIFRGLATACVVRPGDDPGLDNPTICLLDPRTREPLVERASEDEDNLLKLQLDRLRDLLDEDARRRIAAAEDAATTAAGGVKIAQEHARSLSVELERQIKENEALGERLKTSRGVNSNLELQIIAKMDENDQLKGELSALKSTFDEVNAAYHKKHEELERLKPEHAEQRATIVELYEQIEKLNGLLSAQQEKECAGCHGAGENAVGRSCRVCGGTGREPVEAADAMDRQTHNALLRAEKDLAGAHEELERLRDERAALKRENELLREGAESAGKTATSALDLLDAVASGPVDRYGHALNASIVHKQIGGLLLAFAAAEDLHAQQIYRLAQHTGDERWREMAPDKMINLAVDSISRAKVLADRSNDKALATIEIKRRLADAANYLAFAWARWSTLRGE